MIASLGQLWRLLPPSVRHGLLSLALFSLITALTEIATFAALSLFLAQLGGDGRSLVRFAALFALAALVAAGARLWLTARTNLLTATLANTLNIETHRRLIFQPLAFHAHFNSARAIAMVDKVQMVASQVFLAAVQLFQAALIGGVIFIALVVSTPAVAIAVGTLVGLAYGIIARASFRRMAVIQEDMSRGFDRRAQAILETFAGIRDVALDSIEDRRIALFGGADARLQHDMASVRNMSMAPRLIIEGIGMALLGGLVALLAGRGLAAIIPALGLVAFAAVRLLPLAQTAYGGWQSWSASRAVLDDVTAVLALPLPSSSDMVAALPFKNSLVVDGMSFGYRESGPLLQDVSLALEHGSRTGISGATGSGKSTLADLVMGLLTPSNGQLLVDGVSVDSRNARGWQRNIAHVGQQLFLLDASLVDNIAFSDETPDRDRAEESLRRACLEELVGRLDEPVGERGVRLSGGQRQRLGIARAFYKDVPLWILDEATSALDPETEAKVLGNIPPEVTMLVIAHRESALAGCDRRFTLSNGQLIPR